MNKKFKVIIAKEIIFLSVGIATLLFVIGFTFVINYFINSRIGRLNKEIAINNEKILKNDSTDFLKKNYDSFKGDLYVTYILEGDTIDVPQKNEIEFLKKFTDSKKLPINKNGYELYKDSYIYNYIEFDVFDSLIQYDKFYKSLIFEKYYESFDTKNITELDSLLEIRSIIKKENSKLNEENFLKTIQIKKYSDSKFFKPEFTKILKWSFLIVFLIFYPLRFSLIALKWAFKILKESKFKE